MSGTEAAHPRSTRFVVATEAGDGVIPKRAEMAIEEFEEGGRRFVRAYLPGADADKDILVTMRHGELRLRCERHVKRRDRDDTACHHFTFDDGLSIPAGTTPDDVAATYGDGTLLISWPTSPPSRPRVLPLTRRELPVE